MTVTDVGALPVDLGDVAVYSGDPLDISVIIDGEDLTTKTFTAQIRHRRPDSDVLMWFVVTVSLVTGDPEITDGSTEIALHIDGDSAEGFEDGPTRDIPRTAVFDIQQYGETGLAEDTIGQGRLVRTEDVTR